jgi:hypothetical protein
MKTDWITLVTMAGTLFGILISIHFITIKRPGIATKWLGLYTLTLTAGLAEPLIINYHALVNFFGGLSLLYGPFLYLYVKSRIMGVQRVERPTYKHFLPFIIYTSVVMSSFLFSPPSGEEKQSSGIVDIILYELLFVQIFWYAIATLIFIFRNNLRLLEEDKDLHKMKISFMKILVLLSIVLFMGSYLTTHIYLIGSVKLPFMFNYAVQIALCSMIFIIALLNTETMHAKKLIKSF